MQRLDAQQATLSAFELEDALGTRALLDAESFLGARAPLDAESPLGARLPLDAGATFRCEAVLGTNPFPLPEAPPFC